MFKQLRARAIWLVLATFICGLSLQQLPALAASSHAAANSNVATLGPVGTFGSVGSMSNARSRHTATSLRDGRVLVAGGQGAFASLASAEVYDPATETWSLTGSMSIARDWHTATLLNDGRVLVTGGFGPSGPTSGVEIYDPATGTWSAAASMTRGRWRHTGALMNDGTVLVAGGDVNGTGVESYSPAMGTWSPLTPAPGFLSCHSATLLNNGTVLVRGDFAWTYDPLSNSWSQTGIPTATRSCPQPTLMSDGRVLISGGGAGGFPQNSAEIYDPVSRTWSATGSLSAEPRNGHTATLLTDGSTLVSGGGTTVSELYSPTLGTWSATGSTSTPRQGHTAVLLQDGNVLVAGGRQVSGGLDFGPSASAEVYVGPQPGLIFESARTGPPHPTGDGAVLTDFQFVGARFQVSAPTQVTRVGGRMNGSGTLFAAVERLSGPGAMPTGSPFTTTVATAVFAPPSSVSDVSVPLSVLLQPGTYALIFGTARFGASGFGIMPMTNIDLPGASYFHWRGGPGTWVDGGATGLRFFAYGEAVSDATPPTIVGQPDRPANADGWYNAPVTISFTCADDSGIASCGAPVTLSGEGAAQSVTGTATDNAGNTATTTVTGINIDLTRPTIAFVGNAGAYTVDQTILITCVASDALSGVASSTCPAVASRPATDYVGATATTTTTLTATATDRAGNSAAASTTFTVTVTADGICRLSVSLAKADDICSMVTSIATASNSAAKAGKLGAFESFLAAQSGKSIPADMADLLGRLAQLL